jgi:hypothetical protein
MIVFVSSLIMTFLLLKYKKISLRLWDFLYKTVINGILNENGIKAH